jgi:hypothetical protein
MKEHRWKALISDASFFPFISGVSHREHLVYMAIGGGFYSLMVKQFSIR